MILAAVVLLLAALQRNLAVARFHKHFVEKRIYAYRDWQSSGVRIDLGDRVKIEAKGSWSYTPGEYHG